MARAKKDASEKKPPNTRRRVLIGTIAGAAVLALIAIGSLAWGARPQGPQIEATQRTAVVERTSLISAFQLAGRLGYGDTSPLGGGGGVVTKVPQAGSFVRSGSVVMEVEGAPVFLLQGDLPLWRPIGPDVSGPDVAMLRAALNRLGFNAGPSSNQTYDHALSNAIGALYQRAGYAAVPLSAERQYLVNDMRSQVSAARGFVSDAQAALDAAKNRKPPASEIVSANIAVNAAQRAYDAAKLGSCPTELDPTKGCTPDEVASALDNLTLAKALREDLNRPADTTAEQANLASAQRSLSDQQAALDKALLNQVSPETILVIPEEEIRIDNVQAKVGLPASGVVLTWTRTQLYGRADLTEAQTRLVSTGMRAIMTLPDGTEVDGMVAEVVDARMDPLTGSRTPANVRIDIEDQELLAELGVSSVTVAFVQDQVEDTLVVPVTALMALAEGGYCVELEDGALIGVKIGLIADTRAQVFSNELHEGDVVIVP